jgi:hypothetical protein
VWLELSLSSKPSDLAPLAGGKGTPNALEIEHGMCSFTCPLDGDDERPDDFTIIRVFERTDVLIEERTPTVLPLRAGRVRPSLDARKRRKVTNPSP